MMMPGRTTGCSGVGQRKRYRARKANNLYYPHAISIEAIHRRDSMRREASCNILVAPIDNVNRKNRFLLTITSPNQNSEYRYGS
jgi:hypothetical protein